MERDIDAPADVIDLGTASIETRGDFGSAPDGELGRKPMGLTDD